MNYVQKNNLLDQVEGISLSISCAKEKSRNMKSIWIIP